MLPSLLNSELSLLFNKDICDGSWDSSGWPGSSPSANPYIYPCKQKTALFFSGNGYRFPGSYHDIFVLWLLSLCINYLPYMKWNNTYKPIIYYYMNIPYLPQKFILGSHSPHKRYRTKLSEFVVEWSCTQEAEAGALLEPKKLRAASRIQSYPASRKTTQ